MEVGPGVGARRQRDRLVDVGGRRLELLQRYRTDQRRVHWSPIRPGSARKVAPGRLTTLVRRMLLLEAQDSTGECRRTLLQNIM